MYTAIIQQPYLHPLTGHAYRVRAHYLDRCEERVYGTEREALDARDAAFDAGARAVHVAGLPLRIAGFGPRFNQPLINIVED